jgi:hypothetical protein
MRAPIVTPVLRMAFAPDVVGPRLVVAVVGIALPPAASAGDARADKPPACSSAAAESGDAAEMPGRRLRIAGSACSTSVHQLHGSMQNNISRSQRVRLYPAATLARDGIDGTQLELDQRVKFE